MNGTMASAGRKTERWDAFILAVERTPAMNKNATTYLGMNVSPVNARRRGFLQ